MADVVPAQNSQSAHDAHEDLLAALAASRELGPEMDQALADRYLEKHGKTGAVASRGAGAQQQGVVARRSNFELSALGPVLGVAVYIAILIVSHGEYWWTFFLIPMISGLWWGGEHRRWDGPSSEARQARMQQRDDWRQARHDARDEYRARRHGYPYYPPSYAPRDEGPRQASTPPATDARTPSDVL